MHGALDPHAGAAASTVWEILKAAGIDPAPDLATTTWSALLRSQAEAILACDFLETVTLAGQRQYVLAVMPRMNLVMERWVLTCRRELWTGS
jgi:hypothetical protein